LFGGGEIGDPYDFKLNEGLMYLIFIEELLSLVMLPSMLSRGLLGDSGDMFLRGDEIFLSWP